MAGNLIHKTKASGISYGIRQGRYERWSAGQSEFSCEVFCLYDQRFAFALDMLGYANTDPGGADKFTRTLPEFYENETHLPCVALQMTGPEGIVEFIPGAIPPPPDPPEPPLGVTYKYANGEPGLAIFRAVFTSVDYPVVDDEGIADGEEWRRYTLIEETYEQEAQKYPGGSWYLPDVPEGDLGRTVQEARSFPYHIRQVTIHWLLVPHFSRENIENCLNNVNDEEILFTRGTVQYRYAIGTLLFKGVSYRMERSPAGQLLWNLQFHYSWNPATWNKIFRATGPTGSGYYSILSKDGNRPPYPYNNLMKVFSFVEPP